MMSVSNLMLNLGLEITNSSENILGAGLFGSCALVEDIERHSG